METIRTKISEAEGTVDVEELHDLQEKLNTLNDELSRVKDNRHQLEKQLKSTEVSIGEITHLHNNT